MRICKKFIIIPFVLILAFVLALPAFASAPANSCCGLLAISSGEDDAHLYLAVCVQEDDGKYVYTGTRPIQQQQYFYSSVTDSLYFNSYYEITEDRHYDAIKGVYRFELGEKFESGSEADVFPMIVSAKRNDTVYFVYLDLDDDNVFVSEKTQVASVHKGALTTKDNLEKDINNGDFCVIFNSKGDVVGFCKDGIATVAAKSSGISVSPYFLIGVAIGVGFIVLVVVLVITLTKKKPIPTPSPIMPTAPIDDDKTVLDDNMQMYTPPSPSSLTLKCHGGYLNGRVYQISENGITIGREADNTIRYPVQTPGISRHHVRLYWNNGQLMLVDLGSSNGTFMKTGRLAAQQPVPLNPGDVFYLGEKLNAFEIT